MDHHQNELLAITLYHDVIRKLPSLERAKQPSWLQIGTAMRNEYRKSVRTLLEEYTNG